MTYKSFFIAALLLSLMPLTVGAQGTDIKNMCREIMDGERQPTVSNGNNGGMDMMVDDKGVRINFSSRSGMK